MEIIFTYLGYLVYGVLTGLALWGAYCVVMVWRRVSQTRFRSEDQQDDFLEELGGAIAGDDIQSAIEMCEGDRRAMPQLALFALNNRDMGYQQIRGRVAERFEQDVLADIEQRLSWVSTVIKSAPMVGLLGTVMGMMGAFSNIAAAQGGG